MKIIDTHLHFWDLSNNINSWVFKQFNKDLQQDYLPDNVIKSFKDDLVGVVHVEAHDSSIPTIREIKWLQQEMAKVSLQYKHIAFVDITLSSREFKKMVDQIKDIPDVVGIRHILSYNPKFNYSPNDVDLSSNQNIKSNLAYLAENNLIFDCQVYAHQIHNVLPAILDSNVITVVDHALLPAWNDRNDEDEELWRNMISKIAEHETIYLKLSGIDMFQERSEYDFIINHCIKEFPETRLLYGSNYPVSYNHDYNEWYEYLNNFQLSKSAKEYIFFKNAITLFNFEEAGV